ncbi:tetratricopeptide repeat protein [Castellaniella sp.]|uniref:tetratricopeptide repeat protein n=1 Tax=Castellaniella sp. TaxID=1955812 RepID=UPI002AFFA96F|nr:tetratricopeptide repeat protein [Castellaniella sp.]
MIRVFLILFAVYAGLAAGPAQGASPDTNASATTIQDLTFDPSTGEFTPAETPDGGWQAFADLLQKITPSVNTGIPLTPSQITDRIAALTDSGHAQDALDLIQKRESARAAADPIGTDVQLDYQKARALAALGQHDQAQALWQSMTENYPELPEPWNALAIEYARQGQLELARNALNMALASDPSFAPALENLGHVQMALAQASFAKARAAQAKPAASPTPASR